jgi:hypothetical protein
MTRLICDVCGVNDYIAYIIVPEGTFCTNCYDMIRNSFSEQEYMKEKFMGHLPSIHEATELRDAYR